MSHRMLDALPQLVWTTTPDGVASHVSPRCAELTGHPGATFLDALLPDDRRAWNDAVARGTSCQADLRIRHADGGTAWLRATGSPVLDDAGLIAEWVCSAIDITDLKDAEGDARRTAERLELAILGSKTCMWDYELVDGTIANAIVTYTNVFELLGYPKPANEGAFAEGHDLLIFPEDKADVAGTLISAIEGTGGLPANAHFNEHRARHRDGSERWHLSRGIIQRDPTGRATRVTGTSTDITDRKAVERALKESELYSRGIFENAAVGMIIVDASGISVDCNQTACDFLGYTREEVLGRSVQEFTAVPEEYDADVRARVEVLRGNLAFYRRDKLYRRKDGTTVWANVTVSGIGRAHPDSPVRAMAVIQDISARRALELELRKAKERLELGLLSSNSGVFDFDMPDGTFETAKRSHVNLWEPLGYAGLDNKPFDEGIGRMLRPQDVGWIFETMNAYLAGQIPKFEIEFPLVHRDGSLHWRLARGVVVRNEQNMATRFIGSSVDTTRNKQIEAELQRAIQIAESANRAKDEFLANVSHEIRTPMNAILGMTELAFDEARSEHQKQLLSTVKSAARNLLSIINDLLDFSKISAGKLSLDLGTFSLRVAIGDAVRALAARAHRKGLELHCHVSPALPDSLVGDAGRLRQVLMNLMANAIKFTARGEVVVRVELASDPSPLSETSLIAFTVRDTGIGIARDKQTSIFRAFEQEDASTTRKYGGTGLGLTISAQLASLMGGEISVESEPGVGSTFGFTARFARPQHGADNASLPIADLENLRALVASKSETTRRTLVEWLTSWRMSPSPVADAASAFEALARAEELAEPYAIIVVDGLDTAEQIAARFVTSARRLVVLGSDDDPVRIAQAQDSGMRTYLVKPAEPAELRNAVGRTLLAAAAAEIDAAPPPSASTNASPRTAPPRVLIAEDNELNVVLLKEVLDQRGYRSQVASDGRAALEMVSKSAYDLLLLDLHMPELDGFEVVRAIRQNEWRTGEHMPIIALTARSSTRDRERSLEAGMDEFLSKPIEISALWAAIDRLISVYRSPRSTDGPILDVQVILRVCGGRARTLERLCEAFRSTLPNQLSRVWTTLDEKDHLLLREAAHRLYGTVSAFSSRAGAVALALEESAAKGELTAAHKLVEQLDAMCSELLEKARTITLEDLHS